MSPHTSHDPIHPMRIIIKQVDVANGVVWCGVVDCEKCFIIFCYEDAWQAGDGVLLTD